MTTASPLNLPAGTWITVGWFAQPLLFAAAAWHRDADRPGRGDPVQGPFKTRHAGHPGPVHQLDYVPTAQVHALRRTYGHRDHHGAVPLSYEKTHPDGVVLQAAHPLALLLGRPPPCLCGGGSGERESDDDDRHEQTCHANSPLLRGIKANSAVTELCRSTGERLG